MTILITGNMGYVGSCLVRHLRERFPGIHLLGLDIGYFANCLTNSRILPECRVDAQYFMDVRRIPAELLNGIETVIHLAAISNDPMSNSFEDITYEVNYRSSIDLARKAKAAKVRNFVYASSCSMYGAAEDAPRTEKSALNPLTAYAKSKIMAEQELRQLAGDGFKVTSLRFATACGMSDRLRLDLVLNDFVAAAISSKKISILSDGTPWRPLIHVNDMARAMEWAMGRNPENGGEFLAVNVGSASWHYQVKDLAQVVADTIPEVAVAINKEAQPDKRSYRVDFSLYRQLAPEHQPRMDLRATIAGLQDGLQDMGFSDTNFRNSRFMRLMVLMDLKEKGMLNERLEWNSQSMTLPGGAL